MRKTNAIIEVDGKRFMNTKTAADLWGLKQRTVADYCKDGKIPGRIKISNQIWYIPIQTIKPLSNAQIHQLLMLTLQLKNKPSLEIDWSVCNIDRSVLSPIYTYLEEQQFIEQLPVCSPEKLPYEIVLTTKGLEMSTNFNNKNIPEFNEALKTWGPLIVDIASLMLQAIQLAAIH